MPLIKCPDCGKMISDRAVSCPGCGFPVSELMKKEEEAPYTICPKCGHKNPYKVYTCLTCKHVYKNYEYKVIVPEGYSGKKEFNGVYRVGLFGKKEEVYCPRCGSANCSHHQEQRIIPGKTKTRYTANLNPLKPFALVNKKEKVIRKEQTVTESKFICNSCGKIFD